MFWPEVPAAQTTLCKTLVISESFTGTASPVGVTTSGDLRTD